MTRFKHQLRVTAAKRLDTVLPYTSYPIGDAEYLGCFDGDREECIAWLNEHGYHYQLLAARKRLDGQRDVGSYARIATDHPEGVEGTRLAELDPRECQYHIHLFPNGDTVELYGHYEIHPYPHVPTWDPTRPWPRHYRPERYDGDNWSEVTYVKGIVDDRLADRLTQSET